MIVRNEKFISFIDEFTSSTYIMVICSDPEIEQEAIAMNIKASKDYFESLMQSFEWIATVPAHHKPKSPYATDKTIGSQNSRGQKKFKVCSAIESSHMCHQ